MHLLCQNAQKLWPSKTDWKKTAFSTKKRGFSPCDETWTLGGHRAGGGKVRRNARCKMQHLLQNAARLSPLPNSQRERRSVPARIPPVELVR
jgi:hypothetical protein